MRPNHRKDGEGGPGRLLLLSRYARARVRAHTLYGAAFGIKLSDSPTEKKCSQAKNLEFTHFLRAGLCRTPANRGGCIPALGQIRSAVHRRAFCRADIPKSACGHSDPRLRPNGFRLWTKSFPRADSHEFWRQYSIELTHKHYRIDARTLLK